MEMMMKFINCTPYDFTAENGTRYSGFACRCFDTSTGKIVKCKAEHSVDYKFGQDVKVKALPNGRYINYVIQ